jgi:hypothetical protein
MIRFITHYRSLALLFASVILSAIIETPSFLGHLMLFANIGLLLGARLVIQFHKDDYKIVPIMLLVSVAMTAMATDDTTSVHLYAQLANFGILLAMWWTTDWENKNHIAEKNRLEELENSEK